MYDWLLLVVLVVLINLLPGIHANLLAIVLSAFFRPEQVAFALGMHFILSIIPSILYGVSQEVAAAPIINRLAQKDKYTTAFVFVVSAFISSLAALFLPIDFHAFYSLLQPYLFYLVLFVALVFFLRLHRWEKLLFILAGLWGLLALNKAWMFSLFAGLFAVPFLLHYRSNISPSLSTTPSLHPSPIVIGVLLGIFSLLLPGVSPPSVISTLVPLFEGYHFLAYYSSISATQYILALDNYLQTHKLRNAYVENISFPQAKLYLILGIVAGSLILFFLLPHIKTPSERWRWPLLLLIVFLSWALDGLTGIIALVGSSLLGMLAYRTHSSPSSLLGVLILPTLLLLARHLAGP